MYIDKSTHRPRTPEQREDDAFYGAVAERVFEDETRFPRHENRYLDYVGMGNFRGLELHGIIEVKTTRFAEVDYCINQIFHPTLIKLSNIKGCPRPKYFVFYYCDRKGIIEPFSVIEVGFASEAIVLATFEIPGVTGAAC